jgi:phosphoribosylformimino-5-aminoimidazole carboxamide ribotide isomerase
MEIIPAIDLIDGKCVRLTKGDYDTKKVYDKNPVNVAKKFFDAGIKKLHLVDLDGAKKGEVVNWHVLEGICKETALEVDFSGGLTNEILIDKAFSLGAKQLAIGSMSYKKPDLFKGWLKKYGTDKIILGADVKKEFIAVSGWQEKTNLHLFDFLDDYQKEGIQYILCTDISKDGKMKGPSILLYDQLIKNYPDMKFIASGGVTTIDDIKKLRDIGCYGAIIGKAIYEEKIKLKDLKKFIS